MQVACSKTNNAKAIQSRWKRITCTTSMDAVHVLRIVTSLTSRKSKTSSTCTLRDAVEITCIRCNDTGSVSTHQDVA